jgi:hypothetical protein
LLENDVKLLLFLNSIGFWNLIAKKIKKWTLEDRKQFELVQEKLVPSFMVIMIDKSLRLPFCW